MTENSPKKTNRPNISKSSKAQEALNPKQIIQARNSDKFIIRTGAYNSSKIIEARGDTNKPSTNSKKKQ